MTGRLVFIALMLYSWALQAVPLAEVSAKRAPGETFAQAMARQLHAKPGFKARGWPNSAVNQKVPLARIQFDQAPMLLSAAELQTLFNRMRDDRFLFEADEPEFPRRISWLYPDDGCFARAATGIKHVYEAGFVRPAKIFAFGNLMVQTPYSPDGAVNWWYHVAPVVGYMGAYYVLDPAIDSKQPLPVNEWYQRMSEIDADLEGVVCHPMTYFPSDHCFKPQQDSEQQGQRTEVYYLRLERARLFNLGLDAEALLGDLPPWLEPGD